MAASINIAKWGKLIGDPFDLIIERLDVTSAVRLAACCKELASMVVLTMVLHHWREPCLLMPSPANWYADPSRGPNMVFDVVPLDHPRRTAILKLFMEVGHWDGMNGDWLAAVNGAGTWFLVNVYTKMVVYLMSTITCDIRSSTFLDV